jgi:DNA-binding transcriptional LysR family regulator
MDKLASLRAFAKVVELGSFSEAGRQLRLSRSAVSKYVADLERDLGVHLINRTTRRASPTENGQSYFERILAILADLDAADRSVAHLQSTPRGLLRVNAPMSFGTIKLGPVIADFMALHPELQIQLVLSDEQVDPMQEGLVPVFIAEMS